MSIFNRIGNWVDHKILERVAGSISRRLIDLASGALLASAMPALIAVGEWIESNEMQLEALVTGLILAGLSFAWSTIQKKKDVDEIKRNQIIIQK